MVCGFEISQEYRTSGYLMSLPRSWTFRSCNLFYNNKSIDCGEWATVFKIGNKFQLFVFIILNVVTPFYFDYYFPDFKQMIYFMDSHFLLVMSSLWF